MSIETLLTDLPQVGAPLGRLRARSSAEIPASRFSVGCETLDRGMWQFDRAYPHIAALGAKWARVQTGWGKCERVRGEYDFAWLDAIVDPLLAAGIQPWFNVGYGNQLYLPDAPHQTAVGWTPIREPAARAGWVDFVTALTRHYRGRVNHFEIWNEPDIPAFWTPYEASPADYTALARLTAEAIRAASPEAVTAGGALARALRHAGLAFLEECFEHGLGDCLDILTYHLYQATPDRWYQRQYPALRALVDRYRPDMPLWQGESGCPSVAREGQALAQFEWTEARQARWALRRMLVDLMLDVPLITWFHACDFEFYIVKNQIVEKTYHFGLVRVPDYTTKPSYRAMQTLFTLFAGEWRPEPAINLEVTGSNASAAPEEQHLAAGFTTESGPILAWWQAADMMTEFAPQRATVAAWLPRELTLAEPVLIEPISGQVYPLEGAPVDGVLRFELPLTDWPLLLADRARLDLAPGQ